MQVLLEVIRLVLLFLQGSTKMLIGSALPMNQNYNT
jgi:hypothetical protein